MNLYEELALKMETVKLHITFYTFGMKYILCMYTPSRPKKVHDRIRTRKTTSFMFPFITMCISCTNVRQGTV